MSGTIDDVGASEANRAQSQVWMAAVLALGDLRPAAPAPGIGLTPDYVVSLGSLRFALEIKRPESAVGLRTKLGEAIAQVDSLSTEGGVLVFDLSDCLPSSGQSPSSEHVRNDFRNATTHLLDALSFEGSSHNKITNLFVFARLLAWEMGPPVLPDPGFLVYAEVFHSARSGLIVDQAREVRTRVMRGFEAFGAKVLDVQPAE